MRKYIAFRMNKRVRISFLLDQRAIYIAGGLLILMASMIILSLGTGSTRIHPIEVISSIFGAGEDMNNLIVRSFRMPRILLAVLAGAALAVSGAILQGIIRNPLASPDIIGITSGAAFTTVSFLALFSDSSNTLTLSIHWLPLASFIGAVGIGFLVYILSRKRGEMTPIRLVLIGIGIAAAMNALTTMMMIFAPIFTASKANIWITGSLNGTNWTEIWTITPWIAAIMVIVFVYARRLNLQELGDDLATNAGGMVQKDRVVLLFLSTALAGSAAAFAGGIGFVGLIAPHIARKLVGSAFGALLPISALIGAIIVLVADLIARTAFAPLEIPAGVFTSAIGAPYFIYLLYRKRN